MKRVRILTVDRRDLELLDRLFKDFFSDDMQLQFLPATLYLFAISSLRSTLIFVVSYTGS